MISVIFTPAPGYKPSQSKTTIRNYGTEEDIEDVENNKMSIDESWKSAKAYSFAFLKPQYIDRLSNIEYELFVGKRSFSVSDIQIMTNFYSCLNELGARLMMFQYYVISNFRNFGKSYNHGCIRIEIENL